MCSQQTDRKIEKIISTLRLEKPIASLPRPLRFALARKRYGWIDGLAALQTSRDDQRSLIETDRLNTIFIHIPKAAGLSVAESLFSSHAASHTPLHVYLALYGARRFDQMFKFTFVRHPLERTASAFRFLQRGGLTDTDRIWAENHIQRYEDLSDFICNGLPEKEIRNWVHFQSQVYFLRDPRTGKPSVDFMGRFETLTEDFQTVARQLGLEARLKHINRGSGTMTHVSPEAKRTLERIYEEDFELLGY